MLVLWLVLSVGQVHAKQQPSSPPSDHKPELVLNIGHVATVRAVAFSPDSKTVASASDDRTVKLWDTHTGTLRHTLTGHSASVMSLVFAPNGAFLFSGSLDGTVRGWSVGTGARLGSLAPPDVVKRPLRAVAVSLTGKDGTTPLVAGVGSDGAVTLWKAGGDANAARPEIVAAIAPSPAEDQKPILSLAFSSDGKRLATGAGNGSVVVYDTEDGSLQYRFRRHAMAISGLAFSLDSLQLADASADGESALFDLSTGKNIATLQMNRPGDGIGAIAFAPDKSGAIVTGGAHGPTGSDYVMLWDVHTPATPQPGTLLHGHERFVDAVAFSPDGKWIASAGRDRTIRLWDRASPNAALRAILGGSQQILAVAAQPGSGANEMATGGADGKVRLWNRDTGEMTRILSEHDGPVRAVAYAPNGKIVASGGRDKTVRLWEAHTGRLLKTITGAPGSVNALAYLPDGKGLIAGCTDESLTNGRVVLFDTETGKITKTFDDRNTVGPVIAVAVSPDGTIVAAGDGTIGSSQVRFHDAVTGAVRRTDEIPMPATSVAFSSDGKRIAVGTAQRRAEDDASPVGEEIRLYNGQTFAYQKSLMGPRLKTESDDGTEGGGIAALAFLDAGKAIVSAGLDGSLRLWNPRTGDAPVATLSGMHQGAATGSLAVFDENHVVSGGRDNTLLIHKADVALETGRLLATLLPVSGDRPSENEDYLVVTADGFYDGSAGAARRISWRVGDDLFPVEAYEPLLHKPAEVRKALLGKVLESAAPIADEQQKFRQGGVIPPQITFEAPVEGDPVPGTNPVTVRVAVSDVQAIDHLEVLANGRPLGGKPIQLGSKPIQLGSKPIQLGAKPIQLGSKPIQLGAKSVLTGHALEQTFEIKVDLPSGNDPVTLTAIAYSTNELAGREQIQLLRGGAVGGQTGGSLYVLSVGVSTYQNPKFNLKYARSDAEAFADLWKTTPGSASLYNRVETKLLRDTEATSAAVRAALSQLLDTVTEKDTVAIFLSGHGLQAGEGNYYFATYDIDPLTRETAAKTGLPWGALQTTLAAIKARRVLLFLDACHSGGAIGEGQQASGERMAELLAKRAGVLVFSSSRGSEFSYELDSVKHGAFTEAIIEAIGGGKADLDIAGGGKDGVITAEEMLAYLRARVPQLTENRQTPTCPLLRDFGDAYPIARVP